MGKIYGYCRISRKEQNIERQQRNILKEYPLALIVKEAYTGTKIDRPQFTKICNIIKENDTIIFDSVSRMSRNAEEGVKLYFELFDRGVNLIFLKERYIDTETYKKAINQSIEKTGNQIADIYIEATNQVIRVLAEEQIKKAFEQSEKEVSDLHQRTREGIETARLSGKQIGRISGKKVETKKAAEMKKRIIELSAEFDGNLKDRDMIKLTGLSRNTYYKYKKEIKLELEA